MCRARVSAGSNRQITREMLFAGLLFLVATAISSAEGSSSKKGGLLGKGSAKRKRDGRASPTGKPVHREILLEIDNSFSKMNVESPEILRTSAPPAITGGVVVGVPGLTDTIYLPLDPWENIGSFLNAAEVIRCRRIASTLRALAVMPVNFLSNTLRLRSANRAIFYKMIMSKGELDTELWKTTIEKNTLDISFDKKVIQLMICLKEKGDRTGLEFLIRKFVTSEGEFLEALNYSPLAAAAVSVHAEKIQARTVYAAALQGNSELVDATLHALNANQLEALRRICLQRPYSQYFTQNPLKQQIAFDLLKKLFVRTDLRLGAVDCHKAAMKWTTLPLLQSFLAEMNAEERALSLRDLWHTASSSEQFSAFPILFEFLGVDSIPTEFLTSLISRGHFALLDKMLEQTAPVWFPNVFTLEQVQTALPSINAPTLKFQVVALKVLNRYSNAFDDRVIRVLKEAASFGFAELIVSDSSISMVTKKELGCFMNAAFAKWFAAKSESMQSHLLSISRLSSLSELGIAFP